MLHSIVAVFDVKCGAYGRPVAYPADGAAVRAIQDAINAGDNEYAKHPEDYSLVKLGTYDDNAGELRPEKPTVLAQCASLVTVKA